MKPPATAARLIYWAEDDPADRFMVREVAEQEGAAAEIRFFADGQALIDALATGRPEQVVLDIRMPGLDGVATLERLRRDPRNNDLPVVMFSTALVAGELETCIQLGVQAFVQKPSEFEGFRVAVAAILDGTATGIRPASKGRAVLA